MLPKPADWNTFYSHVMKKNGVDFHLYKAPQLQRRIMTLADSKGYKTLEELWTWLDSDKANFEFFLDKMAINVSEMFRNPEKWEELKKVVIPSLLKDRKRLKCWSAGCSYGAEANSLAMLLKTEFPGEHTILGTDIDEGALAQAKRGELSEADVKNCPEPLRKKFLTKLDEKWYSSEEIRRSITFKKQNILADRFDQGFDLILCRNVVIYFTDEAKNELYQKFYQALSPGGILLVGGTERISDSGKLGFTTETPFFYKKPELREQKWQNAS